jgi:hypothetical protein
MYQLESQNLTPGIYKFRKSSASNINDEDDDSDDDDDDGDSDGDDSSSACSFGSIRRLVFYFWTFVIE